VGGELHSLFASVFWIEGDGPYNIFSRLSIFFFNSLDLMEDRMALGNQRDRMIRIPIPVDPKRI
jgi:hypothetical protein